MNPTTIKTGHAQGERAPNVLTDYEWIRAHEAELFAQYGRCCILVYQQQVIGVGQTLAEAQADAEAHISSKWEGEITPVFEILYDRQADWFWRHIRPSTTGTG